MDLKRYMVLLKRWAWVPALFTFACAIIMLGLSLYMLPVYQSSAKFLLDPSRSTSAGPDYNSVMASQSLADTYSQMVVARPVLDKVITTLHLPTTSDQLIKHVTVSVVRNTPLIDISVEDTNPTQAARIANEIVTQFRQQNEDQQTSRYTASREAVQTELANVQADILRSQANLDALQGKTAPADIDERNRLETLLAQYHNSSATLIQTLEDIRLAEVQSSNNVVMVEPARPELSPTQPKTVVNTLLGALIGLLLGLGVVFLRDYLDDSVKSREDAESLTGLPALGAIAQRKGARARNTVLEVANPQTAANEAYRVLAANIEFSAVDRPIRTLLISSGGLAEGKTTTVANLAVAFGQMGKRVIAVDGDLRKPALHRYFDVLNSRGLTSALLCHDTKVEDYLAPTSLDNVYILPSGPLLPDSGELLRSQRMVDLIEELKTRADMVLFDSPPALPVADAMLLARTMDATLLVVAVGGTQPQSLKRTQEQLAKAGTRLVGLVLNRVTSQDSDYYYGDAEMQTRSKRSWLAHRKLPFSLSRKSLQAERSKVKL